MARGEPQLEQAEAIRPPVPEPAAAPLAPAAAPESALPTGARSPQGQGGMRDVLARSTPLDRRRFVLQLQRTAGNAAVCRWLGAVRDRHAARLATGDADDDDAPRER